MGAFDGLGAEIADALAEAGVNGSITYTKVTQGAYDPTTSAGAVTTSSKTLAAIIGACKRELQQGVGVEAGDLKVTIMAPVWAAAFSGDPAIKDKAVQRSRGYAVVAANTSEIGGALVSYSLQLRRA